MSPKQMAECWEAFSLNKKVSELNSHTFQAYRTQLIKDCEKTPPSSDDVGAIMSRTKREPSHMVTPPASKRHQSQRSNSSSVDAVARVDAGSPIRTIDSTMPEYSSREGVGEVVASFRPNGVTQLRRAAKQSNTKRRCEISVEEKCTNLRKPYRSMFTPPDVRASCLEKQLVNQGNELIEHLGIGKGENGDLQLERVNVSRQDKVCCVGRICNEVGAF